MPHSTGLCGGGRPRSAKAARGENLQIEEPLACRYASAFDFHPTLARVLGPTLIRYQVVQVRQPCEKRLLAPTWVMKAFHGEEFPQSPGFRGRRSASEGAGRSRLDFLLIHGV